MNTLDSVIQELILRSQAAGGALRIDEQASDTLKLAFIQSLMTRWRPR